MVSRVRLGSAVVVRRGDTVLLAKRAKEPNRGKWIFPGGKIEPFESIATAGQREVREETGLCVKMAEQIGVFEIINPPEEHRVIVYSWADVVDGHPEPASDVSEIRFCRREELAALDLSEVVAAVARAIGWLDPPEAVAA